MFLKAKSLFLSPFPNALSRLKTHLSCHQRGRYRLDWRGTALKPGQQPWASLTIAEYLPPFPLFPIGSHQIDNDACFSPNWSHFVVPLDHVMSVDVLRVSFCSPLVTSFFLFPFPFFPTAPAVLQCGIKLFRDGVQRGHGGLGAGHSPPGSAWPTGRELALPELPEMFVTTDAYRAVMLVLENFSF